MRKRASGFSLRSIPSVDRVLREIGDTDLPRPVVVSVIRRELENVRLQGREHAPDEAAMLGGVRRAIDDLRRSRLQSVINGTGIILHTNFGRAPLGPAAVRTLCDVAANYNNLEYDLVAGRRGARAAYLERSLAVLCGAEDATVVNNCAAAMVLALRHFASRPPQNRVVISRGELVQIGGGFRIPEILEAAGCVLVEIGTTNKTTLDDYRRAIDERTAMILRVHQSNFYMGGFVESPGVAEIAAVARDSRIPFLFDIGSGATFNTESLGGDEHEPTAVAAIKDGADLVTFSGDKLLGGPQAGIVAGRSDFVQAMKNDPFFRALRCDKLILAALQTTVELLLSGRRDDVKIHQLTQLPLEELRTRAARIIAGARRKLTIGEGSSRIGGGSLPRTAIRSVTVDFPGSANEVLALQNALRANDPPIIGYLASNVFKLDLRTIFPEQDIGVMRALGKFDHALTED